MRMIIILLALAFIPLQAHAGLLDDLGSALRGDTKKETLKQDASLAADRSSRNLAVANPASGKRIALVIGNGNYHYDNLPKLPNPTHDAEDIAKALRGFGFEVIEIKDQSLEGMNEAITEFGRKITDSEAALFYFAGHGLQVKGQNYLVPTNARIESESQVPYQSVNVNQLLDEMDNGKSRANIVMLDACRNNPISGKFRSGATRGLAAPASQPKGTVIVYATDPGNVAADGKGRNGLFTAGLLTAFKGGDLSLGGVLTRASEEVERGSDKKQIPYVNGPMTLQKDFHFGQGTQVASLISVPARVKTKEEIEDDYWNDIKDSNDLTSFEQYSKAYPEGRYLNSANLKIAQIRKRVREVAAATSPPALAQQAVRAKTKDQIEDDTWSTAETANAVEAINAYLVGYPKGRYQAQARVKLAALKTAPSKLVATANPITASPAREDNETALWNEVKASSNKGDYEVYLAQYSKGKYAALAKGRIKKLEDEDAAEAVRREQDAWEAADKSGSEYGYQTYLKGWPAGRYAGLAQARLRKLQADLATRQEQELWQKAQAGENAQSVQAYLDNYPRGNYVAAAQEKLAAIRKAEAERTKRLAEYNTNKISVGSAMPEIAKMNNCSACHAIDKKVVGPAWMDVSRKYRGDAGAMGKLTRKIRDGGSGVWGRMPMPAMSKTSEADAVALADFILRLTR